jgi:hypothetical protein
MRILVFMGNPLIAGFVEKQHEAKILTWSGKTTEGKASPSDCHNTAKIMPVEDFYRQLIIAALRNFGI